jgi:hypothetical protein
MVTLYLYSSLSNCRVSSGEADFTVRKFKDDGKLWADNMGHRLLWTGKRKVFSQNDKCLGYGEDYMEKKWDNSTIACELLLLELTFLYVVFLTSKMQQ